MSTDLPIEAIRTLIATCSELPSTHVVWDGEEEPAVMFGTTVKAGKITLNPIAREIVGPEEILRTYDEGTGELVETYTGQRIVTISCRADNFLGLGEAYDLLERVRIRLMFRSSRKALRDAGLSYVDAPSISVLDYQVDQRAISSANLDVRLQQSIFEVIDNETADPLDRGETIEKVTSKSAEEVPNVPAAPVVDFDYTNFE